MVMDMKVFEYTVDDLNISDREVQMLVGASTSKVCFFDIETTGLSPDVSSVYLIGVSYFDDGKLRIKQWYADDYKSEPKLLTGFANFLADYDMIIHYNGGRFDVPYLEKKYSTYQMDSPFGTIDRLDLYLEMPSGRDYFHAKDNKLTTMEQIAGYHRQDTFSGKECIHLYTEYIQKKYFKDPLCDQKLRQLLLHNHDDLIGTTVCVKLLSYRIYTPFHPTYYTEADMVWICDKLSSLVPRPTRCEKDGVILRYDGNDVMLGIPLITDMMYHFFENYKDYYYLPAEDMAVHKSVGVYVDPAHRKKATKSICYIKKEGDFLPIPEGISLDRPIFMKNKRDHAKYIHWDANEGLATDECAKILTAYVN